MWSSGTEMSFESLKAQALVSDAQYALMALAALGAAAILGWLGTKFWRKGQTEGKPMSDKQRRRRERTLRRQFIKTELCDAITDKVEELYFNEKINRAERKEIYTKIAQSLGFWDLVGKGWHKLTPVEEEKVKEAIKLRLADPTYREAAKLPDLVDHSQAKPLKKTFRKVFGAGLRTQA